MSQAADEGREDLRVEREAQPLIPLTWLVKPILKFLFKKVKKVMMKKKTNLLSVTGGLVTISSSVVALMPSTTKLLARQSVTKNSGTTPTIDTVIYHSLDGINDWIAIMTFTQVTTGTAVKESKQFLPTDGILLPYIKATSTYGGTDPNFDHNLDLMQE